MGKQKSTNKKPSGPKGPGVTSAGGVQATSGGKPWEHAKGGQAGSESDPLAARFVESLTYDRRLYRHDIAGSLAHARMLHRSHLLSADELAAIEKGLREIEAEITAAGADDGAAWPGWKIAYEDVHMCIEKALIDKIGEPGRKLHTGRSRNDQVALDLKLWVNEAIDAIMMRHQGLIDACQALARSQGDIVMPSYTHLQRAQPITLAGEMAAWRAALERAQRRLATVGAINRENPLGAGAIAGSSLPLDRAATAMMLPLGDPSASSIDATASRDIACDYLYALAMTAMTLSRWAEQWILYATTEFGFLQIDPRYTTGSSMMPQKRNPDMLELIRGRCGNVYGHLTAMLTIVKGLPIGYNRDLQEDKRQVFAAHDLVSDCLEMAQRIVATATFRRDRIAQGLDRGFLDATSLAEYFVTRGVPFRTAHQIVGALVARCEERGFHKLAQLALEDFHAACAQAKVSATAEKDVYDWLGPENVVRRYQTLGHAAPPQG